MSKKETCGARIATARRKAGLTLQSLADKIGVSKQAVSLWEADDRSPRLDNLRAIASACSVPVQSLIGDAP